MAFPAVQSVIENAVTTAGTSHVINLPGSIAAGDLLLILLNKGSTAGTFNALAGWTELVDENLGNGITVWYRKADGTEGSTVTFTHSSATRSASLAYRITGALDPAVQAPQLSTVATGTSVNPDATTCTPTGGAKDYLWITFFGMAGEQADDDTLVTTFPTNYTNNQLEKTCGVAGTNLGGMIGAASRNLNAASDDAGSFTAIDNAAWRAYTIAVHPPANTLVTPTTSSLVLATFAATVAVTANILVTPTTAALTLTSFAPTVVVSDHKTVTPATASLTLTTFEPTVTVSSPVVVTPTTAALVLSTFAPTVAVTDNQTVVPGTAALTLTPFAPTVSVGGGSVSCIPSPASLILASFAPTVATTAVEPQLPSNLPAGPFAGWVRAEDGSRLRVYRNSDNWAALQAFCDLHTHITFPQGAWQISKCLNFKTAGQVFQGEGVERTILVRVGVDGSPVIGIGGHGNWASGSGYVGVNGCQVRGMTLWQTDTSATNCVCFAQITGDDYVLINVRVRGSIYEGFRGGGKNAVVRNIEAWDCGNGLAGVFERSTAGINLYSANMTIDGFVCLRCGQGVESGYSNVTIRNGVVAQPLNIYGPNRGIGIGSSVVGSWNVVVENCIIDGYHQALDCGGGNNGRLAKVIFRNNRIRLTVDGSTAVTFSGGAIDNLIPTPEEGPTIYGSEISGNEIRIIGQTSQGVINYVGGGPVDPENGIWGREPLTISRNTIIFELPDPSLQTAPVFGFGGKITAACVVYANTVLGLPTSPIRGDIQSLSTDTAGHAVPGMPSLTVGGNFAYDLQDRPRDMLVNLEGA